MCVCDRESVQDCKREEPKRERKHHAIKIEMRSQCRPMRSRAALSCVCSKKSHSWPFTEEMQQRFKCHYINHC